MRRATFRALSFATASLLTVMSSFTAQADDSEIFIQKEVKGDSANLLLIIDTSGSMHQIAETSSTTITNPYNSTLEYPDSGSNGAANCNKDRIYYRPTDSLNVTVPTSCTGLSWIDTSARDQAGSNQCSASRNNLQFGSGKTNRTGSYRDSFIQWRGAKNARNWTSTIGSGTTNNYDLECLTDDGVHGSDSSTSNKYPLPGASNTTPGLWTNKASSSWWKTNVGTDLVLWSPNLIRYTRNPSTTVVTNRTRMEVVKQAAKNLLDSPMVSGMKVGLMRYSSNAEGGMVVWPVLPVDQGTNRQQMKDLIDGFKEAGSTPLSETLYEAHQYFAGGAVTYGKESEICTANNRTDRDNNAQCEDNSTVRSRSIATSRLSSNADLYKSPADVACQKNYIVYLTDGLPTSDGAASGGVQEMIKKLEPTALWDTTDYACETTRGASSGQCLAPLAKYMNKIDLRPDATTGVAGLQTVQTFFIGFGDDFSGSLGSSAFQYLERAAAAGGGDAFQANNLPELDGAFNSIVSSVADTNSTFTAPTVAVNAFNRTQTLSDLYVAVFQPSTKRHWPGNLKKYSIENGVIEDRDGHGAVNTQTGFFKDGAHDIWTPEGETGKAYDVTKGGAANRIPDPGSRKVYTYTSTAFANPSNPVTLGSAHELSVSNVSNAALGLTAPETDRTEATTLINWALGHDVPTTNTRHAMGDPMHSQPAVIIYGGTATDPDAVVYMPTNDGYLHAINAKTGVELWSFIPQEVLPQLKPLYENANTDTKHYTLDGEVRVLKYDINGDGAISGDDRVFIYFGQGRGGSHYYGLDVTNKNSPKFMWSIALPDAGRAWSPPTVTRVSIDGVPQNKQKLALVMGGGYDPAEDDSVYVTASPVGNRIYMVDALKGNLLWSAGSASSTADLKLDRMDHSIPSRVTVMDVDQDGFADRMYVGDMAAQLWRFDITNSTEANRVAAKDLVRGGVLASLGARDLESPSSDELARNARRFYNAPDITAMKNPSGQQYMNVAIGSGYRGKPTNLITQDRLYSIRDYAPFRAMTADEYGDINDEPLLDGGLQDITETVKPTLAVNATGWKLRLGAGEKVLSDSTTFDQSVFFVTFTPSSGTTPDTCIANSTGGGTNRAYIVRVTDGAPVINQRDTTTPGEEPGPGDPPDELTTDDRSVDLQQGGIASGVTFLFPEPNKLVCLSGVEVLGACTDFKSRVKTYWRETNAN